MSYLAIFFNLTNIKSSFAMWLCEVKYYIKYIVFRKIPVNTGNTQSMLAIIMIFNIYLSIREVYALGYHLISP